MQKMTQDKDRQADAAEMPVTSEMIKAGLAEFREHTYDTDINWMLECVFRAMAYASPSLEKPISPSTKQQIDRRTAELEEMKSLYLSIGGVLVDEEIEVPDVEPVKRLTGPKAKPAASKAGRKPRGGDDLVDYIINGHTLTTSPRKRQVIEKLWSCREVPVPADELVGFYGGKKELLYAEITAIKKYLAPLGFTIINERGLGFRMETY